MSETRSKTICDKCGEEITTTNFFPRIRITKIRIKETILYSHDPYNYTECGYDLCKKCAKEFEKFMRGDEVKQ